MALEEQVNVAMIGVLLIALSVAMLVSALPRRGQVVGITQQGLAYVVAIASLHWGRIVIVLGTVG